ncbi:MAG: hypothetical protein IKK43_00450 [Clostridia bacterium]|nr:hypothetical protein [Clostridia bacterium]
MKSKLKISSIFLLIIISMFMIVGCSNNTESSNNDITKTKNVLNAARIMSDGSYQIRFSDLVELEALKEYNNKTVTALGYLSPIMGYDGSFGYLMNLPYQTCPYCLPSDTKITNTIAIFTEKGKPIDFTEAAVLVKGTLKLEPYTDEYGYSYNYRIVDVTIEKADTSELGEKITLYNKLAEKEILTRLMDTLYWVDENVYYDEYTANGYEYDRSIVDFTNLDAVISDLSEFNQDEVSILLNTANSLKEIGTKVNELTKNEEYEKIKEYKEITAQLFYKIGDWMSIYEL